MKKFSVIEHFNHFAVRHNPSGKEHPMGDGVDAVFDKDGEALSPGDPELVRLWENDLNNDASQVLEAYFPELLNSYIDNFEPLQVQSADGLVVVELEWHGEGKSGDYDPEDQHDTPLLRYTVYRRFKDGDTTARIASLCDPDNYQDGDLMPVTDGSYCTQVSTYDLREDVELVAKHILGHLEDGVRNWRREKRLYEIFSGISTTNLLP